MRLPFVSRAKYDELQGQLFFMEKRATEAEQFERIAGDKLKHWVEKHDTLLVAHKELLAQHNVLQNIL
jgi:hypothetical protein